MVVPQTSAISSAPLPNKQPSESLPQQSSCDTAINPRHHITDKSGQVKSNDNDNSIPDAGFGGKPNSPSVSVVSTSNTVLTDKSPDSNNDPTDKIHNLGATGRHKDTLSSTTDSQSINNPSSNQIMNSASAKSTSNVAKSKSAVMSSSEVNISNVQPTDTAAPQDQKQQNSGDPNEAIGKRADSNSVGRSLVPHANTSLALTTNNNPVTGHTGFVSISNHNAGGNSVPVSANASGTNFESSRPLTGLNKDHGNRDNTTSNRQEINQQNSNHHNRNSHHQSNHHHNNQNHHAHQHSHQNEQLSKTNLYIRGLHADTSDNDLFSLCSRFGNIVSTKAILDKMTNKCKGYGFVDFENPTAAEVAVSDLQKQGILVHMAKQQEADPTNLYIANLPPLMTESELESLLRPYGTVVSTRILINQNRQPRGVGFARMESKEQCDAIINSLNGQMLKNCKDPLLIKFADGASKKRVHHSQHKPLSGNNFLGDHLWRNNSNDSNYHLINSGSSNRGYHGFEHPRQPHVMPHHNNGIMKHSQMMPSMQSFHVQHQPGGHHSHSGAHINHQHHHQSQVQQHRHGHNHTTNSSHRNQSQGPYSSSFPIASSMGSTNDASQWLHPPQAGQPYVLPQMMGPTSAMDPSFPYVNIANQMQGLQIGNPAVSGYMSPQQWPVWTANVGTKHSGVNQGTAGHGENQTGYNETE